MCRFFSQKHLTTYTFWCLLFIISVPTCIQDRVNYAGNALYQGGCGMQPDSWNRESPKECINLCHSVEGCTHFTWISPESGWVEGRKRCCLKSAEILVPNNDDVVVSGVVANCESNTNNMNKEEIFFFSIDLPSL